MADRNAGRNAFERHQIAVEEAKQQIEVRYSKWQAYKIFYYCQYINHLQFTLNI
jgi:hypothetical protein